MWEVATRGIDSHDPFAQAAELGCFNLVLTVIFQRSRISNRHCSELTEPETALVIELFIKRAVRWHYLGWMDQDLRASQFYPRTRDPILIRSGGRGPVMREEWKESEQEVGQTGYRSGLSWSRSVSKSLACRRAQQARGSEGLKSRYWVERVSETRRGGGMERKWMVSKGGRLWVGTVIDRM